MRVFITGSTGLLGSNIVQELLNNKHQVTALVRSLEKGRPILDSQVELVEGDLQDVDRFAHKLTGIDVVIHAAAYYSEYYRRGNDDQPHKTNVGGTISLLEAAWQQGIKNVVYISSGGVLETYNDRATDESTPDNEGTKDPYFRSKIDAEREIYRLLSSHPSMRIVLLLPGVLLGPGDRGPTPTGNFVLNFLKGKVKFIIPGSMNIVDARDVALGAVKSIHTGQSGERYLIGGRKYPIEEIFKKLAEVTGKPELSKRISLTKLLLVARIMALASKITRKPPALKLSIIRRLQENFWYNSSKAEHDLGVHFRPLSETLSDTAQWFHDEGYV